MSWEVALETAAKGLKAAGADLATIASASSTVEELYLLGKLTRALGSANIDHRLRQVDFRDQADDPAAPGLGGLVDRRHRPARCAARRRLQSAP